jgi:hypothetical protein
VAGHAGELRVGEGVRRVSALGGRGLVYIGCCNNVIGMLQLVVFMLQSFVVHVATVVNMFHLCS